MRIVLISLMLLSSFLLFEVGHGRDVAVFQPAENNSPEANAHEDDRKLIIQELKRFQGILSSNDKVKISAIFGLPVSSDLMNFYIDSKRFDQQLEASNHRVTQNMFIEFYDEISESIYLPGIRQFFNKSNFDALQNKNELRYNAIERSEPCYYFYTIKIEGRNVTITAGITVNTENNKKQVSGDKWPEICEHTLWWKFKLVGNKLCFEEINSCC